MDTTRDFPDYSATSIVNLMQSIGLACGSRDARYPPLALLSAARLAEARHIVLLVVDGLGQRQLERLAVESFMRRHRIGELSSVFPSTTATSIPTFMTGLAPSQHGLTGWHTQVAELGESLAVLPMHSRADPRVPLAVDLAPRLFNYPTLYQQLTRESWVLSPRRIVGTPFNAWHTRGARSVPYDTVDGLFATLGDLLDDTGVPRFIYAYYPELDLASHRFGTDSTQAKALLDAFDARLEKTSSALRGCDAWIVVTADHGFIDSPPERTVCLDDHPRLTRCLAHPLSGESRAAYAYVLAGRGAEFEAYVRHHLAHCVDLRCSAELLGAGWFGPPPYHPRLHERIGDYTLLMKEKWTIKDWLPDEKRFHLLGVHGGISNDETRVPLIAIRA